MLVLLSDPRKVEGASSSDKTTSDGASLTVPEPVRGRSPSSSPSRSVCLPPSLPPVLQHSFPASHKSLHSLLYIILGKFQRNFAYSSRYLLHVSSTLLSLLSKICHLQMPSRPQKSQRFTHCGVVGLLNSPNRSLLRCSAVLILYSSLLLSLLCMIISLSPNHRNPPVHWMSGGPHSRSSLCGNHHRHATQNTLSPSSSLVCR